MWLLDSWIFATNKVNTFTEKVTETREVETVQIVALKDSKITKDQSFNKLIMAYLQEDNNAIHVLQKF